MIKLQIKKFQMSDLMAFDGDNIWQTMEHNLGMAESSFLTLFNCEGIVVAILGLKYLRPGVVEVGIFRSKEVVEHKKDFARVVKNAVDKYIPDTYPDVHRAELYTDIKWKQSDRWAKFLGFQFEGICRAYDPELTDHKTYSRIYGRAV